MTFKLRFIHIVSEVIAIYGVIVGWLNEFIKIRESHFGEENQFFSVIDIEMTVEIMKEISSLFNFA